VQDKEPDTELDDYKNIDVKGKWAVILEDMPVYLRKKIPQTFVQKYLSLRITGK